MSDSLRLGKIAGIEIRIHYTWIFAFVFFALILAESFHTSFPHWSSEAYWIAGVLSSLLLFVSVLIHELAHSLVAQARGIQVRSITLFIFGGVSNISGEAERAQDEFVIAVVGPLTSLVLAGVFWLISQVVLGEGGITEAIVGYLTFINVSLGLFNLLPGFPLDGGRVLRSILWGSTHSIVKATNIAAVMGQIFGWLFIGGGAYLIFSGNFLNGLWIAFIGWFLNNAADSSRREMAMQANIRGVRVNEIMDPNPMTVDPQTTISELVFQHFLRLGRRALPVTKDGQILGIITLSDVKELPQERWGDSRVEAVMTRGPLYAVSPDEYVSDALKLLAEHDLNQVLVKSGNRLVGILTRSAIIRYFQSRQELGLRSRD